MPLGIDSARLRQAGRNPRSGLFLCSSPAIPERGAEKCGKEIQSPQNRAYERPEPKLFLTDGRRLILYLPNENRMTEMAVKESGDFRTPLRFLLGNMRFAEEFQRIETSTDFEPLEEGNLVLKAFSERLENRLEWEWVLFEVSPQYHIRRLVIQEPGDIQQEFRFEDEESNLPLSDQLFRFLPPEGTEVIRQ